MYSPLHTIFNQFDTNVKAYSFVQVGSGHIHQTFRVIPDIQNHSGFILQKLNTAVFPNYEAVMDNTRMVIGFLKEKTDFSTNYHISFPVKSKSGNWHVVDETSTVWRLFTRISPGISFDTVPNKSVAYEASCIFGTFLAEMRSFPVQNLHTILPGFHSINHRYEQFQQAINLNPFNRLREINREIDFAKEMQHILQTIPNQSAAGNLPVRVTHNDTKLNNIIFNESDRALAVIDLDTIMPGLSLYDFGDLVRTAAIIGTEDSPNISFSLPLFKAIAKGYLLQTKPFLTPAEMDLLPLAPQYMAYIIGLRFLTDYLNGDTYYSIKHPEHNLQRARSQFRLLKSMMAAYNDCVETVRAL